jgi:3-oxoacyl-[acyl-carrier protein] reductase
MVEGKVVVVTGGSRGIGREIVEMFLRNNAIVHYMSRNAGDSLQYFRDTIAGADVTFHSLDVSDEGAVTAVFSEIIALRGAIDVLVNNAGITKDGLMMRMSATDWQNVIDINLTGSFLCSRAVARQMIKSRGGSIINITSVVGKIGNGGQANYASSKAGLIGLTKSMAREVGSRGVRVNAIAPGFIETEMTDTLNAAQREALASQIPMGRIGSAREVASVCLFLASDMASYITGEVVTVGGGLAM